MSILTRNLTDKDLNRFERWILKNIQKHGWHANGIPVEGSSPDWAYSVGLFAKYGQPELIVFGLEIESSTMNQLTQPQRLAMSYGSIRYTSRR